jgi:cytochrome P450
MSHPQYYHDPDTFNPDRFTSDTMDNMQPSTLLTFGIGPRACMGAKIELKLLLFSILKKFELVQKLNVGHLSMLAPDQCVKLKLRHT